MHEDIRDRWLRPERAVLFSVGEVSDGLDLAVTAQVAAALADLGAGTTVVTTVTSENDMWARLAQHSSAPGLPYGFPPDDETQHRLLTTRARDGLHVVADTAPAAADLAAHLAPDEMMPVWRALVVCDRTGLDVNSVLSLAVEHPVSTVVAVTGSLPEAPTDTAHAQLWMHGNTLDLGALFEVPKTPVARRARVTADPYGGLLNTMYSVTMDHGRQIVELHGQGKEGAR